jgi:hypothetical protein
VNTAPPVARPFVPDVQTQAWAAWWVSERLRLEEAEIERWLKEWRIIAAACVGGAFLLGCLVQAVIS